jgi:hypothetical protein
MWIDIIVEETRKVREEHAEGFDFNLKAIYEDLKEQEKRSGREVVSLTPKEPIRIAEAKT